MVGGRHCPGGQCTMLVTAGDTKSALCLLPRPAQMCAIAAFSAAADKFTRRLKRSFIGSFPHATHVVGTNLSGRLLRLFGPSPLP